ncbi:TPA: phage tail tape measure protein [Neisseria weaveri]
MSADLAIGVKVGFSAGAAIAGLGSVRKSMVALQAETQRFSARQRMLGNLLSDPLRMSKERVGELKREYAQLGITIDKLRNKSTQLGAIQLRRQNLAGQRQELLGQVASTASIATTAVIPVKLAMDFESAMAGVKKTVEFDSPQQFQQMNKDILALTRSIPMAAKDLAGIAASGGQLGVARKDIVGFTETVAKMSVAFDMTAEQAGDSMAKLANVYNIPIAQIGKLGDAVNHLSNNSPAKASDIVNTLGRVGGVAKQFGLTELQTASLANAFISLGKTPEVAGTAVNGMLTKLGTADKQGKKFQDALKAIGTDSKTLKKAIKENGEQALMDFLRQIEKLPKENQMGALVDLFGLEYADDVAALVGGLDTYKKSIDGLKQSGKDGKPLFEGSMEKEFKAQSETTAKNWELFKNSMVELAITVGATLLPAVNSLLDAVKPVIHGIADWAAANPAVTKSILGFVAGLALFKVTALGTLFAANVLMTGWSFIPAMFAKVSASWLLGVLKFQSGTGVVFRSVSLIKTALGGLRAALPLAKAFTHGLVGGFIGMAKLGMMAMRSFAGGIIRFLPMLASGFLKLGMALMSNPIFLALGLLAAAAYLLYTNWEGVVGGAKALWQDLGNFFGSLWTSVTTAFQTAWSGLTTWFSVVWLNITTLLSAVWESIKTTVSTAWESIKAFFSTGIAALLNLILTFSPVTAFMTAFQAVWTWLSGLGATFMSYGSMMIDGLVNGIRAGIGRAVAAVQGVVSAVKSAFTSDSKGMGIHSPSRVFAGYGGYMTEGLAVGIKRTAGRPLQTVGAWAGRLKERFGSRVGSLRADLAARISSSVADFASAREQQAQAAAGAGGITVNFNPTINAPGGDTAQIQTALSMSQREFEMMFKRMMADMQRKAY